MGYNKPIPLWTCRISHDPTCLSHTIQIPHPHRWYFQSWVSSFQASVERDQKNQNSSVEKIMATCLRLPMASSIPCSSSSSMPLKHRSFNIRCAANSYSSAKIPMPPLNPNDPFLSKLASVAANNPDALFSRPQNSDTPPFLDIYDSPKLMATPAQVYSWFFHWLKCLIVSPLFQLPICWQYSETIFKYFPSIFVNYKKCVDASPVWNFATLSIIWVEKGRWLDYYLYPTMRHEPFGHFSAIKKRKKERKERCQLEYSGLYVFHLYVYFVFRE